MMEDFATDTDSEYTSYWRDWVSSDRFSLYFPCAPWPIDPAVLLDNSSAAAAVIRMLACDSCLMSSHRLDLGARQTHRIHDPSHWPSWTITSIVTTNATHYVRTTTITPHLCAMLPTSINPTARAFGGAQSRAASKAAQLPAIHVSGHQLATRPFDNVSQHRRTSTDVQLAANC